MWFLGMLLRTSAWPVNVCRPRETIIFKKARAKTDPLPSWNEGPSKTSILRFVEAVTAEDGAKLVAPLDRIADAEREWTYDRGSPVDGLDKALDEARRRGWTVVDMARESVRL